MSAWSDRLPWPSGLSVGSPARDGDRQGKAPPVLLEAPFAIPVDVLMSLCLSGPSALC